MIGALSSAASRSGGRMSEMIRDDNKWISEYMYLYFGLIGRRKIAIVVCSLVLNATFDAFSLHIVHSRDYVIFAYVSYKQASLQSGRYCYL